MAITYQDAVTADFSVLERASSAWLRMGEQMGRLGQHYQDHRANMGRSGWTGDGHTAWLASSSRTQQAYAGTEQHARSVGQVLDEGYQALAQVQDSLRGLVKDAESSDFHIDANGEAHYQWGAVGVAAQMVNPAYRAEVVVRERQWTAAIRERVVAIDQIDVELAKSLNVLAVPEAGGAQGGVGPEAGGAHGGVGPEAGGAQGGMRPEAGGAQGGVGPEAGGAQGGMRPDAGAGGVQGGSGPEAGGAQGGVRPGAGYGRQ